jgi:hypothetical protein
MLSLGTTEASTSVKVSSPSNSENCVAQSISNEIHTSVHRACHPADLATSGFDSFSLYDGLRAFVTHLCPRDKHATRSTFGPPSTTAEDCRHVNCMMRCSDVHFHPLVGSTSSRSWISRLRRYIELSSLLSNMILNSKSSRHWREVSH